MGQAFLPYCGQLITKDCKEECCESQEPLNDHVALMFKNEGPSATFEQGGTNEIFGKD